MYLKQIFKSIIQYHLEHVVLHVRVHIFEYTHSKINNTNIYKINKNWYIEVSYKLLIVLEILILHIQLNDSMY